MQPRSLFLLGAPDAEMQAIESLLRDAGQAFVPAAGAGGARVKPGEPPAPGQQTLPHEGFGPVERLILLDVARATLQRAKMHPAFAAHNLRVADLSSDPRARGSDWSAPDESGVSYPIDYMGGPLVGSALGRAYIVRVKTRDGYAFRGGGGGDAGAAAALWPSIAEEVGCHGPKAPAPTNAYAFPDRGLWGGTIRWEPDGPPVFVPEAACEAWGVRNVPVPFRGFIALPEITHPMVDVCDSPGGGVVVQPLRLACDPPTR